MNIDIRAKSVQLLERLAISLHERDPSSLNMICFRVADIRVVEVWLEELLAEIDKDRPCEDHERPELRHIKLAGTIIT